MTHPGADQKVRETEMVHRIKAKGGLHVTIVTREPPSQLPDSRHTQKVNLVPNAA